MGWGETIEDWRSDTRAIVFAAVMVALGVIGLVVSFAYTLAQSTAEPAVTPRPAEAAGGEGAHDCAGGRRDAGGRCAFSASSASRSRNRAAVLDRARAGRPARADRRSCSIPASLGVALVLVFDKATRAWGEKRAAEATREWLLCDLLMFLLLLAFLNLRSLAKPEAYVSSFWDILNLVLFFAAFWVIDRTASRSRFLSATDISSSFLCCS